MGRLKMKRIMIFAITLALIASGALATSYINTHLDEMKFQGEPQKEIFKAFHYLHEKEYSLNSEEGLKRYRIFKQNAKWIEQENAKLSEEIFGITQFSDLTQQEFNERHLMNPEEFQKGINEMEKSSTPLKFEDFSDKNNDNDNDHNLQGDLVDWTQYDGPIKNQKSCGSCWAFAALAAIENKYHKMKKTYTPFSEQYLVDCDNRDSGCRGGYPTNTFMWIAENGIVHSDVKKYVSSQEQCDYNLKKFEYKIVTGSARFSERYAYGETFEDYLKNGPVVVGMDASFNGFGQYRPRSYKPIVPSYCRRSNHAVAVVGMVKENGQTYVLARNSWGKSWGYKGYFKMERKNNCNLTTLAWLPRVIDGKVPDNHPPKPTPKASDCVDLYGSGGFNSKPLFTKVCDSTSMFGRRTKVTGVKYPAKQISKNPLVIKFFASTSCYANPYISTGGNVVVEHSEEFLESNGKNFMAASMAFEKPAKDGCVEFYGKSCLQGEPLFSICNNIADSQYVNLGELARVRSFSGDPNKIKKITFYGSTNYTGKAGIFDLTNGSIYNLAQFWQQANTIRRGLTRSVKLN